MIIPSRYRDFEDLYVVMEYFPVSLYHVANRGDHKSIPRIDPLGRKVILFQILCGLKMLHDCGIMHRDLASKNCLVDNTTGIVKITDYNLAIETYEDLHAYNCTYVCTDWYAAPELLADSPCYNKSVDMWALGCILAEMVSGVPMFRHTNYYQGFLNVVRIFGCPSERDFVGDLRYLEQAQRMKVKKPILNGYESWKKYFPHATNEEVVFMKWLLKYSPDNRISVDELLSNSYFQEFEIPEDLRGECHEKYVPPFTHLQTQYFLNPAYMMIIHELCTKWLDAREEQDIDVEAINL
jgi:mitogen-activated protein kinase 1/3